MPGEGSRTTRKAHRCKDGGINAASAAREAGPGRTLSISLRPIPSHPIHLPLGLQLSCPSWGTAVPRSLHCQARKASPQVTAALQCLTLPPAVPVSLLYTSLRPLSCQSLDGMSPRLPLWPRATVSIMHSMQRCQGLCALTMYSRLFRNGYFPIQTIE